MGASKGSETRESIPQQCDVKYPGLLSEQTWVSAVKTTMKKTPGNFMTSPVDNLPGTKSDPYSVSCVVPPINTRCVDSLVTVVTSALYLPRWKMYVEP